MTDVFLHTHSGRNRRTLLVLALVYGAILTAVLMIDLSPWIAGVMVLFTLPALWEVATNPQSRLEIDQGTLAFSGPNGSQSLMLNTIDHVLFETRLDFSVRVTIVRPDGKKLRLPPDALPNHMILEKALNARGVTTKRRHFSLL